jgi:hypothetical protein
VIKKFCSDKWDSRAPLGGFKLTDKKGLDSDSRFLDGEHASNKDLEHETGRDFSNFRYDENNNENAMKLREDAEARRNALLLKMRSTNNSGFTDTETKSRRRRRMLNDPDGVIDDMSNLNRPAFQRELNMDEIQRILAENPEITEEFDNERQRWLEFGEEDPNNVNPLSDYNTLLVSKMQKGYDNKADDLVDNFRNKNFNKKLAKIEEERQHELDDLEMDKLEMQGRAVAFSNAEGAPVRKKIKKKKSSKMNKKKSTKKGKMFILNTPYGQGKYYKRKPSPPAVEDKNVMFQNTKMVDKKAIAKAKKMYKNKRKDSDVDRSGSSIVEADEVMFETGFGPNADIQSDGDEMDEADMVIYNKDDMTQFSKNLGVNKMKSRLTMMGFKSSQGRLSTGEVEEDNMEDDEAQFDMKKSPKSPGPQRKIIQKKNQNKKKKKKTKAKSISSAHSFQMSHALKARSAVDSTELDSEPDQSSEEDNPNDRSGLLSHEGGKTKAGKRKGKITKKNKWVGRKSKGRKSYRENSNLSLVLPRYKSRMKRNKLVLKKKTTKKMITSNGSPYEEYLPARFRDVTHDQVNISKVTPRATKPRHESTTKHLVPLSTSKPPVSKTNKDLDFYGKNQKSKHKRANTNQSVSSKSLGTKSDLFKNQIHLRNFNIPLSEQDHEGSSEPDGEHQNVMFQRNINIAPFNEDGGKNAKPDLLHAMNKDFHEQNVKLKSVDSRNGSKDGSRAGSKGRTYASEEVVFSSVRM